MARSTNNVLIILIAMIIGVTILACLCFATIFFQPNIPFNPLSPDRATRVAATRQAQTPSPTITNTPAATFPPTWTPTMTFTPLPTKTATNTRTPTATRTPTGTATLIPTATATAIVLPTFTPEPPFDFTARTIGSENNCANIKLAYSVVGDNLEPSAGYQVEYGEIGVRGSIFQTDETQFSEIYGVTLIPGTDRAASVKSHNWFAYLLDNGLKVSEAILFTTDPIRALDSERCTNGNTNANANNSNNSNSNNNAGCIPDPCTSADATNVKIVQFQPRVTGLLLATPSARLNLCEPPYQDFVIPRKCSDCRTQQDAQRLFTLVGGPRVDIYDFDRDNDGVACENRPLSEALDCANFATQAEAQRAWLAAGGTNKNTDPIDPDRDGIACEELP